MFGTFPSIEQASLRCIKPLVEKTMHFFCGGFVGQCPGNAARNVCFWGVAPFTAASAWMSSMKIGFKVKPRTKVEKSHFQELLCHHAGTHLLAVAHLWPCKGTWIIWRWTSFLAECRRRCRLVGCQCITTTWTLHYWCITLGSTAFDSKHGQLPLRLLSAMRAPGGAVVARWLAWEASDSARIFCRWNLWVRWMDGKMFPKKMRPAKISHELAREVVACDGHKICILLFFFGEDHHSKNMRRPCCDRKIGCYVLVGDFWCTAVCHALTV